MIANEQYFKSEQDKIVRSLKEMTTEDLLDTYYYTRKQLNEYPDDESTQYTQKAWYIQCETVYIIQQEILRRCGEVEN